MSEYVCENCGYPAINSTIFRDKNAFAESLDCPECGSGRIIKKDTYCYKIGWKILRESGADAKIKKIDGIFLKLSKTGDDLTMNGTIMEQELPPEVAKEFKEKTKLIEEIIKESDVLEKLKKLGVQIEHFITVIR